MDADFVLFIAKPFYIQCMVCLFILITLAKKVIIRIMHWVNAIKSTRVSKKLCFDSIAICTIRSGNN
jgi:hypothetical protein